MARTNEPFSLEERLGSLYSEHLEWQARARDLWAEAERCRRTGKHEEGRRLRLAAHDDLRMTVLVRQDLLAAGVEGEEVERLARGDA